MQQQIHDAVQEAANNPIVAHVAAATTAAVGVATWLDKVSPLLGVFATFLGIVLSGTLIWSHSVKTHAELKRIKADTALAEAKRRDLEKNRKN